MTNITRAYSKSPFDHVGMILKFETDSDEIYILEATSNNGVAINKWSFLNEHIGADKFYDKLVYRKVNFDRNDGMIDKLE